MTRGPVKAGRRPPAGLGLYASADTPEQAANLCAGSDLMRQITAIVKESNWTRRRRLSAAV